MLLALVIAPIATELPEKFNSLIWVRQGKDTLAMGNITGRDGVPVGDPDRRRARSSRGEAWHVTDDSLIAFVSAGIAFIAVGGDLRPDVAPGAARRPRAARRRAPVPASTSGWSVGAIRGPADRLTGRRPSGGVGRERPGARVAASRGQSRRCAAHDLEPPDAHAAAADRLRDRAATAPQPRRARGPHRVLRGRATSRCGDAKVSIMTHAFMYGTATFEGIRGYWNAEQGDALRAVPARARGAHPQQRARCC